MTQETNQYPLARKIKFRIPKSFDEKKVFSPLGLTPSY
jgi:hypothetical protein